MIKRIYISLIFIFLNFNVSFANQPHPSIVDELTSSTDSFIKKNVKDNFSYYGLASLYKTVRYFIVSPDKVTQLTQEENVLLKEDEWLAAIGHHDILLLNSSGLSFQINKNELSVLNPDLLKKDSSQIYYSKKSDAYTINDTFNKLQYAYLFYPLKILSNFIEKILLFIHTYFVSNWGWVIFLFAILFKLVFLPINLWTSKQQKKISILQTKLAPKLAEIKKLYRGEEAHQKFMAAHKELGVTPFYTLRTMLSVFIQIPFLIAVFNALGEMDQLSGQHFLWIKNLAQPDAIMHFNFSIPWIGNTLNLLPILMTAFTLFSAMIYKNDEALPRELRRQKRNLYLMAFAFFILFYPFPAAMVLYWTLANILQTLQQRLVK